MTVSAAAILVRRWRAEGATPAWILKQLRRGDVSALLVFREMSRAGAAA